MEMRGHIHNGVVVLDEGAPPPEGSRVRVVYDPSPTGRGPVLMLEPGRLPLVCGGEPGRLNLTNERINEILEAEEAQAIRDAMNVSS